MKKGTVGKLVIGLGLLVIGFGCKKYDEGPGLSLRTKKARATAEWVVSSYTSNGSDIMNEIHNNASMTCSGGGTIYYNYEYKTTRWLWNFKDNGDIAFEDTWSLQDIDYDLSSILCETRYTNTSKTDYYNGTWAFTSNKEKMEIKMDTSPLMTLDIKELREVEMKLEGIVYGELVKITLTKK